MKTERNGADQFKKRNKEDYDLDLRLVKFAAKIIAIANSLPKSSAGSHISGQLERSGTSPALHYGEAQAAESPKDFIHKLKVSLKELRETFNCLRLISELNWLSEVDQLKEALIENDELIAIFITSIKTARRNSGKNF
jgi:four helix bundle protein